MKSIFQFVDRFLQRYTPDPFVIAILLTATTLVMAIAFTNTGTLATIEIWGDGLWSLAAFTLQMAMILVGGFVVANSPPVQKLLGLMILRIRTPVQAVLFCTVSAMFASWVNWGFGLVVGGVVAVQVATRVREAPFRVLVAASYSGFLVWHAGLSGSIPLALNSAEDKTVTEVIGQTVPLSETMFGTSNLVALACMILLLPGLNLAMLRLTGRRDQQDSVYIRPLPGSVSMESVPRESRFESSFWLAGILGGIGVAYVATLVGQSRFSLNLNTVMTIFFLTGLVFQGSPAAFSRSVERAVPRVAPLLILYPLYAGIMALLVNTGLGQQISELMVDSATQKTLPVMAFFSAGLVNLFVPSGGGQWVVQAPVVVPAAQQLGADIGKIATAVAWGDAWTNMLQPFWAVPLLAIAGLKIRDIIGILFVVLVCSGAVLGLVFYLV